MSITTADAAAPALRPEVPANAQRAVTFPRAVHSEWIKFRTLRSSWLVLAAAVAALIVIGTLIGYNTGKHPAHLDPEDTVPSAVLQGYYLGQLLIGVLGVLFVSGEYSTGMIRSTMAAVPRRIPVLVAKALVFGVICLITLVPTSIVAFLAAQAVRGRYLTAYTLSDSTALRVVIGTGVYLTLIGLLGGAIGWIVRSTPGGISALVGLLLVVPVILRVLPGAWVKSLAKILPGEAGDSFVSSLRMPDTLAPWTGLGVLGLWVLGMLAVAGVLLARRDT